MLIFDASTREELCECVEQWLYNVGGGLKPNDNTIQVASVSPECLEFINACLALTGKAPVKQATVHLTEKDALSTIIHQPLLGTNNPATDYPQRIAELARISTFSISGADVFEDWTTFNGSPRYCISAPMPYNPGHCYMMEIGIGNDGLLYLENAAIAPAKYYRNIA